MLFIVRHAHAVSADEDPLRPLSLRGHDECTRMVAFFGRNGAFTPKQVWHSPLIRARETADRLVGGLRLDVAQVETPGLMGEDDPEILAQRLAALPQDPELALVGHEPHLGHLVTLLTRGKPKPVLIDFKKGTVIALQRTSSTWKRSGLPRWEMRWMVTPDLLPSPGIPGETSLSVS